ncbi:MAG: MgtC/SapB family protein, partial [Chloroflexota bacterium]|nr:MgtC/SapB family protein [Chloroflexota bacterium]
AVKETRDVGFIFFTMAIGMAVGTQFYTLAVIGAVVISLLILLMVRFNWFAQEMANQILRIQVPGDVPFEELFESAFLKYTSTADLIAVDSIQSGTLTEVTYNIGLKKLSSVDQFLAAIKKLNNNNKVTLVTGYHGTDL